MKPETRETGFHDRHGIPIYVGDLIRVMHYVHYRNRRMMWLYFRVAQKSGRFVVQNWHDLDPERHQCLLEHVGGEHTIEVLQEGHPRGEKLSGIVTFNERPRKKAALLNARDEILGEGNDA